MSKKKIIVILGLLIVALSVPAYYLATTAKGPYDEGTTTANQEPEPEQPVEEVEEEPVVEIQKESITLSFAGDVTMGNYATSYYSGSFDEMAAQQSDDYFFEGVKSVFENDDLTIVNLEGPLTTATSHLDKKFAFKGDPAYANILKLGDVDLVSYANNHSEDYYTQGLSDTKAALDGVAIGHFGYDEAAIQEVRGVRIGFLGYRSLSYSMLSGNNKDIIKEAISNLKDTQDCDFVVVYYHWGIESTNDANSDQRELAHYTIDCGGDLVIGSHPHVLQGMETYKGKRIVYSLGNFCFGGNRNPSDKDTMIYQTTLNFEDRKLVSLEENIIPCSISSVDWRNDFHPVIVEGARKDAILTKIESHSF